MGLKIIIPQIRFKEGAIWENFERIKRFIEKYDDGLILFPELALVGYYAGDLIYYLAEESEKVIDELVSELETKENLVIGIGYPELYGTAIYNSFSLINSIGVLATWRKMYLPTFGIFEEHRYFRPADSVTRPITINEEFSIGVVICYDAFFSNAISRQVNMGAEVLVIPAASPIQSRELWEPILRTRAIENNAYIIYVNHVGFRDSIFFYGESRIVDPLGKVVAKAKFGEEDVLQYVLSKDEIIRASTRIRPTFRDYRHDIEDLPIFEEL